MGPEQAESSEMEAWARTQKELAAQVVLTDDLPPQVELVGGLDVSYATAGDADGSSRRAVATYVLLRLADLQVQAALHDRFCVTVPYMSGYLAFREVPAYQRLLSHARQQGAEAQVVMVDGYGVLHPRRCGVASHLGVLTQQPTIGVAKSPLVWGPKHTTPADAPSEGTEADHTPAWLAQQPLVDAVFHGGQLLGAAVRAHGAIKKPVYVSAGHRLSLPTAVQLVQRCCQYRVPEPVRQADIRSRQELARWCSAGTP